MLKGKKTYILVVIMILISVLTTTGLLTQEQYMTIMSILLPGSMATIRMGMKDIKKDDIE